jgi:hypothetical protein
MACSRAIKENGVKVDADTKEIEINLQKYKSLPHFIYNISKDFEKATKNSLLSKLRIGDNMKVTIK